MTPKKIALLTDSSADLRWDQARENNIFFVPLRILCEDGEYLDGVNITGPDIYQRLHNGELPQTSLPRVEDFSAKLREIFDLGYDGVIAVMLSSGLSGTYNLARILAGECAEQGYAMKVFDSVSGALGQGMTVLQLAEDIKNGMDWEELTERRAPQLIANTYPFFSVDTLEYLVKGGRIGKVTAMAGTMLQIKPIKRFHNLPGKPGCKYAGQEQHKYQNCSKRRKQLQEQHPYRSLVTGNSQHIAIFKAYCIIHCFFGKRG